MRIRIKTRLKMCAVLFLVFALLAEASFSQNAIQSSRDQELNLGPVINVKSLESLMDSEIVEYRILDLGPDLAGYQKGHLPKALYVDWIKDITAISKSDRYNLPTQKQFEALMGRCGVKENTHLVFYDDLNNRIAVRMYFIAKYFGHQNIHILDGGKTAWKSAGFEFSKDKMLVQETIYKAKPSTRILLSTADDIFRNLKNGRFALIDGRPADQYTGKSPGKVFHTGVPHKKRGHIPGAVNIAWQDHFKKDGTFKTKKELNRLYSRVFQKQEKSVVSYCNEGLHAAVPWFVLSEILGKKNVTLYDDSMCEWANSERPTETD